MGENETHKKLKSLAIKYLINRGITPEKIQTEYHLSLGNIKRYRVDVAFLGDEIHPSIAIECGNCERDKLLILDNVFDEVIHFPYGFDGLFTNIAEEDLTIEQQGKIAKLSNKVIMLEKQIDELHSTLNQKQSEIERSYWLGTTKELSYLFVCAMSDLMQSSKLDYYGPFTNPYSEEDRHMRLMVKPLQEIAIAINDTFKVGRNREDRQQKLSFFSNEIKSIIDQYHKKLIDEQEARRKGCG